jgi:transcription-repair coupling factor (superfamily II helicase)
VPVLLDAQVEEAATQRLTQIRDAYDARFAALKTPQPGVPPYKPVAPDALYLTEADLQTALTKRGVARLTPFAEAAGQRKLIDLGGRAGRNFIAERNRHDEKAADEGNVFDAVVEHVKALQAKGKRIIIAVWSEGARERLGHVLADHKLKDQAPAATLAEALSFPSQRIALALWGLETGFETDQLAIIGEQDILGDRLVRRARRTKRAQDFISEVATLTPGDLVVHVDHGIGRFVGLKQIDVGGAPHDCVEIHYADQAKLYLPVENLELLSRYGSEDTEIALDRLGGGAWQARKAKLKERIREMAHALIKIAAERLLREAPRLATPDGLYDEFCARFPYDETEDQLNAIEATLNDMSSGRPMDRLICGDVGFGKTEVALRAAFVAALSGKQVAIVVPTTLLARQHYRTFKTRFEGLPVTVRQASRFVSASELKATKDGLADGSVDIVIGTHALLGKTVTFKDLGLMVIDEEQHFGVGHKEKLKSLRAEVHVLTLSATPIPRTLQLALTGVRELSIIATPPVDRLAVRTFVTPFDPLTIREALLRERYRGGQSFYVCPRIEDIAEAREFLGREIPEVKVAVAHGQMPASELESIMTAFYEGHYDVLLSTAIVESGLDIPTANTLIVHRADMFGLSALYQLRGRVGRSKIRAYALFTVPANRTLTVQAERRLKVLQSLDGLGAGFQLASHDLDIRGAGNLLGDEQSGHIKEVGYELYQQMLEDAVTQLKAGIEDETETQWSPSITIGMPVMIPETYIEDLTLRLSLYKRLSSLEQDDAIDAFGEEMADRFGPLPNEVRQLLGIMRIKLLCRRVNVEKIDAGPKGLIFGFRDNSFAEPEALMRYIMKQGILAKIRPDMKVVFIGDYAEPQARLEGTLEKLRDLVGLVDKTLH